MRAATVGRGKWSLNFNFLSAESRKLALPNTHNLAPCVWSFFCCLEVVASECRTDREKIVESFMCFPAALKYATTAHRIQRKKTLTRWMSSSLIQSEISLFFKSCFALELCCAMPQREWSYFNWVCVPKKSRTLLYFSSCTHIVLSLCMLRVCGIMCLLWLEPNDEQFGNFSRSHIAVDILEKSFAESFE